MSCPYVALTGEEIHKAFRIVDPDNSCSWEEVPELVKMKYDDLAPELNRKLNARLAQSEDDRPISAVKCPKCGHMLTNLKNHPCF